MKRRTQWIAVAATIIGAGLQVIYLKRFEAEVSGGPRTAVLVAKRDLGPGTKLTDELLALRDIPEAYLDLRHIPATERETLLGQALSINVRAGESLLWSDLAAGESSRQALADRVRPGMRAVTLRASGGGGFGDLLRPGDRVDVLVSAHGIGSAQRSPSGITTLMQNVVVLAVDGNLGSDEPNPRSGSRASEVTVSVTPADAERVANLDSQARITLTLRNPDDTELDARAQQAGSVVGVVGVNVTETEHGR